LNHAARPHSKILKAFIEYFLTESQKGFEPERIGHTVYMALTT
jgi:hypothetical protein